MIIDNLKDNLSQCLQEAMEVFIAVATVKERGLKELFNLCPINTFQSILVGIELPMQN